MESQFNQTNIAILSPALPPADPSSPNLPLNVISAVVLGLFLGFVAAGIAELANPRVETGRYRHRYMEEPLTQP